MQTPYVIELEDNSFLPSMTETSAMIVSTSKPDTNSTETAPDPVTEAPVHPGSEHVVDTSVVKYRGPDSQHDTGISEAVVSTARPRSWPDAISVSNGELANPEDVRYLTSKCL